MENLTTIQSLLHGHRSDPLISESDIWYPLKNEMSNSWMVRWGHFENWATMIFHIGNWMRRIFNFNLFSCRWRRLLLTVVIFLFSFQRHTIQFTFVIFRFIFLFKMEETRDWKVTFETRTDARRGSLLDDIIFFLLICVYCLFSSQHARTTKRFIPSC